MLLAYRRGLLKQKLPFGITSRIREMFVIDAMSMEQEADYAKLSLLINNILLAPNIDTKRYTEHMADVNAKMYHIASRNEYDASASINPEEQLKKRTKGLVKVWNKLFKSGTIKAFAKKAQKIMAKFHS